MKSYLVQLLDVQAVERISICAQMCLVLFGAMSFYESGARRLFRELIGVIPPPDVIFVWLVKGGGVAAGAGEDGRHEEAGPRAYFIVTVIVVLAVILSGRGLVYWATFPFKQLALVFTVWSDIFSGWKGVLVPFKSLFHLLVTFLLCPLLYALVFGVPLKSAAFAAQWCSKKLSPGVFHFSLFLATTVAGIATVFTSGDWFAK